MNQNAVNTLGAKVKALRLQLGLSQRALAEGLVSKSMISQIEADKALPSAELLALLAARLGVTAEVLQPAVENDRERADRYKHAQTLLALGHEEEALPLLQDCLADPHPSWELIGLSMQTGQCLQRLGRLSEARTLYEEALRLAVRDDNREAKAELLMRLGGVAFADEQWNVALQEWKQAHQELLLVQEEGTVLVTEWLVEVCLSLGRLQQVSGRPQEALNHYREAQAWLACEPIKSPLKTEAVVHVRLGETLAQLGEYAAAEDHLRRAVLLFRRVGDRKSEWEAGVWLGKMTAAAGETDAALALLRDCVRQAEALQFPDLVAKTLLERAVIYKAAERWCDAIATLQQALEAVGTASAELKGGIHRLLAETYADKERWDQALLQAEQARACLNEERSGEELYKVYRLLTAIYKQRADYKVANDWVVHSNLLLQKQLLKKGWRV